MGLHRLIGGTPLRRLRERLTRARPRRLDERLLSRRKRAADSLPTLLVVAATLGACDQGTAAGSESNAATRPEVALLLAPYRPDDTDSDELFRFEPGHDVESFDGDLVRVHFTRSGPDAVKLADTDGDDAPDAVELVAETYDEVLTFFAGLGFRAPVTDLGGAQGDGGDGRLDVYLIDFDGASDGAWVRERCDAHARCSGYVVQENDFAGYGYPSYRTASRILASHELFHAVQAAYDADQGANWSEATAVWASERFDPSLSDLENFADGWLDEPDRSIDQEPTGPVASYSYGLGIFAQYLYERFGDTMHLGLWEAVEDGAAGVADPHWLTALVALLASDFATTFDAEWVTFATWALRASHGDSGGPTFASAGVLPRVARDIVSLPFSDDKLRIYATSLQVWSTRGDAVSVAIVSTVAGDTDGLVLITGLRKGDQVRTTVQPGFDATLDGTGSDEVIIAIASTNLEGNNKRPGFCLGSAVEVAACRSELVPVDPEAAEPGPETVEEEAPESVPEEVAEGEQGSEESDDQNDELVAEATSEPAIGQGDDGCGGAGAGYPVLGAALGLVYLRRRPMVVR